MEAILVKPRTEAQMRFFRDLLANLRWDAEVEYVPAGAELPEGERYWPVLDDKIRDALREEKEGRAVGLDLGSFEGFLQSIREHGDRVQR